MSDLESLRQIIAEIIPLNRALDISITSVSPDRVELMQPEAPERLNTVGDVHTAASAIFTLGEAATEAMVIHAFHRLIGDEGVVPFVVKTTINYHRPTRGQQRGICTLSQEEQSRVYDEMVNTGRARFIVSTQILEESGKLVADLESLWGLRKPRATEAQWLEHSSED
jgi:acyl-coenzyme A thioesterase PaaI-like protein